MCRPRTVATAARSVSPARRWGSGIVVSSYGRPSVVRAGRPVHRGAPRSTWNPVGGSVSVDRVQRPGQVRGVPEEVDLLLLAHDHVLEQVLQGLAARLLPGGRDDGVQCGDRLLLCCSSAGSAFAGSVSTSIRPTSATGLPPSADAFSVSVTMSSVSA